MGETSSMDEIQGLRERVRVLEGILDRFDDHVPAGDTYCDGTKIAPSDEWSPHMTMEDAMAIRAALVTQPKEPTHGSH